MIRLHIKGNVDQARDAAQKRGISLVNCNPDEPHKASHAECLDKYVVQVIGWFCESAVCGETGFPPGTLLLHNAG